MARLPIIRSLKAKLKHFGLRPDRNAHAPERIFVEEWVEMNTPKVGFNNEHGVLDHILNLEPQHVPRECVRFTEVSQRDADVAASVIQWLGTKEGLLFIQRCEKRIEEAHKDELAEHHRVHNLGLPAQPRLAGV
jgi:hypothetical protein